MKIALSLLFILFSFSNLSAQQLEIKFIHISFADKFHVSDISFSNTDSTSVFPQKNRYDHFTMNSYSHISVYNKNPQRYDTEMFDPKNGTIIDYKPIDRIDNYRYLESEKNSNCLFCGDHKISFPK